MVGSNLSVLPVCFKYHQLAVRLIAYKIQLLRFAVFLKIRSCHYSTLFLSCLEGGQFALSDIADVSRAEPEVI